MKQYFYIDAQGNQVGPIGLEELRRAGISTHTLVWTEGMPAWSAASTLTELAGGLPPVPLRPTPPPVSVVVNQADTAMKPNNRMLIIGFMAVAYLFCFVVEFPIHSYFLYECGNKLPYPLIPLMPALAASLVIHHLLISDKGWKRLVKTVAALLFSTIFFAVPLSINYARFGKSITSYNDGFFVSSGSDFSRRGKLYNKFGKCIISNSFDGYITSVMDYDGQSLIIGYKHVPKNDQYDLVIYDESGQPLGRRTMYANNWDEFWEIVCEEYNCF